MVMIIQTNVTTPIVSRFTSYISLLGVHRNVTLTPVVILASLKCNNTLGYLDGTCVKIYHRKTLLETNNSSTVCVRVWLMDRG